MLLKSLSGDGLIWKDKSNVFDNPDEESLKQYNIIYNFVGKGNTSKEYRDKSLVSNIKKSLMVYRDIVTNIDVFVPKKVVIGESVYQNVPVLSELVYVIEGSEGNEREVRFVESEFYNFICNDKKTL